jgi:outer membrane immunogenic protein
MFFSGAVVMRLGTAVAAIALIAATPAFAADMAVKAPPAPPPAPVYNWTGFYVGGNVGASFGRAKTDYSGTQTGIIPAFANSAITEPSGFIGGGQIGYNWQFSPIWVAGIEADIQWAHEVDHNTVQQSFAFAGVPGVVPIPATSGTEAIDYNTKIDWFGTVRARAGYLWGNGGSVLTYITGGLAYGRVGIDGTTGVSITTPAFFTINSFSQSKVNTGWTVGSGTEGMTGIPGLTYRIEYLYVDLGSVDTNTILVTGTQIHTHTHFNDNIIRAGFNYLFH